MVAKRAAAGRTNATIRRDLTALSSVLSFAEDQGWREGNPALSKMRRLSERRDPIYLPEHAHIEFVIARAPKAMGALIRAAWLTGARQSELIFAERKYLSPANRTLYLSRAKGNRPRTIELELGAREIISAQPTAINAPWIFHHDGGAVREPQF